jgi:hypothetical protein
MDIQGRETSQVRYLKFTPKAGSSAPPFTLEIDHIAPVKNLVYAYRINE